MPSSREQPGSQTAGRLSDAAFQRIKALIHEGRFAPGERLPAERELADLLSVSRPTLRDALNRLEARGYVDRRTGSGNYICTSVPETVRSPLQDGIRGKLVTLQQIIDVRKPLEVWGAREAARCRSEDQLVELEAAVAAMRVSGRGAAVASQDAYARADVQFHVALAKMTGNPVFLHTLHFLTALISESLAISREILDPEFADANNATHERILDAIAAGDATEAGRAMATHFRLIERRIRDVT